MARVGECRNGGIAERTGIGIATLDPDRLWINARTGKTMVLAGTGSHARLRDLGPGETLAIKKHWPAVARMRGLAGKAK